ncbi:MAG: ribosomal protein S18-alanine N-acetyltransferase [Caldilineales bacterium]|nr:ribosomal protein S18-alanine N-acetyltransferase [Caldilineales bacterium]
MFSSLPFRLEPMRLTDIPHVMAIERQVFTLQWTSGIYRQEITSNRWSHYFVLRTTRSDLPVVLSYGGIWQMDIAAHIPTIASHPDFSCRGLGSLMLLHLLDVGYDLGCTEATLEVRDSNVQAQRFYERHGFKLVGRRKGYYSDNWEDALLMTRQALIKDELAVEITQAGARAERRWREAGAVVASAPR